MKAILLCAGFATRLYPLTRDFPKPLLPVAGTPILEDLLEQLFEIDEVEAAIVVSNDRFFEHFERWRDGLTGDLRERSIEILNDGTRSNETRLGAVADLAFALESYDVQGPIMVAPGDNVVRFSLPALFADHARSPRNLVTVYREADREKLLRTGVAQLDERDRIVRFVEKSPNPASDIACPPFYLLERDALAEIPGFLANASDRDAPGNLIAWLAERLPVYAHRIQGRRLDIGNLESYREADAWLREHPGTGA